MEVRQEVEVGGTLGGGEVVDVLCEMPERCELL